MGIVMETMHYNGHYNASGRIFLLMHRFFASKYLFFLTKMKKSEANNEKETKHDRKRKKKTKISIAMGIVSITMHCFHCIFNIANIRNIGNAYKSRAQKDLYILNL